MDSSGLFAGLMVHCVAASKCNKLLNKSLFPPLLLQTITVALHLRRLEMLRSTLLLSPKMTGDITSKCSQALPAGRPLGMHPCQVC